MKRNGILSLFHVKKTGWNQLDHESFVSILLCRSLMREQKLLMLSTVKESGSVTFTFGSLNRKRERERKRNENKEATEKERYHQIGQERIQKNPTEYIQNLGPQNPLITGFQGSKIGKCSVRESSGPVACIRVCTYGR